jgi:hypothetical protein
MTIDQLGQLEFFSDARTPAAPSVDPVRDELIAVVQRDWAGHGRGLQREPGPSEVGAPCTRQIAAKIAGAPKTNVGADIFPAWAGTAVHSALEAAFLADNARLVAEGLPERWITERRVEIAPGLAGTADLFDIEAGRVCDFKVPGASAFSKYKKSGPSEVYRQQAHLYCRGYQVAGYEVREASIFFIPRAANFGKSFLWSEPYNEALALETVARLELIRLAVDGIAAADDHVKLDRIPAVPNDGCRFCDFYSPTPRPGAWTCPGK